MKTRRMFVASLLTLALVSLAFVGPVFGQAKKVLVGTMGTYPPSLSRTTVAS